MRNSKRLLATLLTLCIMASFVFTGTAFAADESAATLTFPAQIVNVNGTAKVELAGATADEYVSSDETIAEVSNDGVVTGKAIGRVTITAKENGEAIASVEIPVVGENLLIKTLTRNGIPTTINYGAFEAGEASYLDDRANRHNLDVLDSSNGRVTTTNNIDAFWWICTETGYADALSVVDVTTPAKESTKAVKYSMTTTAKAHQFAMRSGQYANNAEGYEHVAYGSVPVVPGKVYELSAWGNYDSVKNFPAFYARVYYKNADATKSYSAPTGESNIDIQNAGWNRMQTTPISLSDEIEESVYAFLYFGSSNVAADSVETLGDIYVADVSFHEVAYAPVFKSNSGLGAVKVGFETSTQFIHLSNTGKEVISVDASGKKQTISVTYDSLDKNVATVDNSGNITAVGAGTAVITATATAGGQTVTRAITFDVEKDVVDAFTPDNTDTNADYNEPTVITITKDGVEGITSEPNGDGTHTVTAPAEKANGSKFLYWAKGLTSQKKILLYKTNVLTDYLPDEKNANYLIPVYEDDISAPEYYNANGQLIPGASEDTTVTMPGYGTSIGWIQYGENIYVAKYELDVPAKNITITTTNCTTDKDKYGYGDPVTCTATGTEGTFKCWKKDGEIVSVDPTYTFKAWENCAVEAVYVDNNFKYTGAKMKIIIDSFSVGNDTGVMAEFIGLGNAIEKGIMFTDEETGETTSIAMATKDSQFSVVADEPGTYVGYAILRNGDAYTLITDGECIHN